MEDSERKLQPRVSPKAVKIISGFAIDQGIGKATAAERFIHKAIDSMPEDVQKKYMGIYDRSTPEARKNPRGAE